VDLRGAAVSEVQARYGALLAALLKAGLIEAADELRDWADENDIFGEEL
jgi:hypothetical protein